ncbi:hypothetical protein H5410_020427 [Solanum commersonii]|uniref:Uncharacterized protein n=1 Tax=Solanum commersonii TaxID=4109 RepID=A0A9J5Z909_SOLCO|nr:hypothetical protein H5410_020427 [Solanum commersonii]
MYNTQKCINDTVHCRESHKRLKLQANKKRGREQYGKKDKITRLEATKISWMEEVKVLELKEYSEVMACWAEDSRALEAESFWDRGQSRQRRDVTLGNGGNVDAVGKFGIFGNCGIDNNATINKRVIEQLLEAAIFVVICKIAL